MFIYNVTVKVDWAIHESWLSWMQHEHLPEMVATGCFTRSQLLRLLGIDEEEGPTYTAQYFTESKSDYDCYINEYSLLMRKKVSDNWGEKIVAFRSLMEIVH